MIIHLPNTGPLDPWKSRTHLPVPSTMSYAKSPKLTMRILQLSDVTAPKSIITYLHSDSDISLHLAGQPFGWALRPSSLCPSAPMNEHWDLVIVGSSLDPLTSLASKVGGGEIARSLLIR